MTASVSTPTSDAQVTGEALLGLIRSRRSIRRYVDRPVPVPMVERLLSAAIWAPSAHNRQPWRFVVLTLLEDKHRLAEAMAARLRQDRLADGDPLEAVDADAARSQARITASPVVLVACLSMRAMDVYPDTRRKKAEYTMAVQSTAMALQNLLLAASAEGLGACWMCAPLFCPDTVRETLDLPDDWEPQALVTLGYPANAGKRVVRSAVREKTLWR